MTDKKTKTLKRKKVWRKRGSEQKNEIGPQLSEIMGLEIVVGSQALAVVFSSGWKR